jgi:hypothetical protein
MQKILILIGMTIVGWVGWWLGAKIGLTAAFLLSCVGSIAGVYLGWRVHRDYLG